MKAILTIIRDTLANILTPDGETQHLETLAGVLQGDNLSPHLFVIVLDYASEMLPKARRSNWGSNWNIEKVEE